MNPRSLLFALAVFVPFAGTAKAQTTRKLTTLFASNNGGSPGGAVYFDLKVVKAIRITQLETNYGATLGTPVGIKVYTTPTTYVGKENNASAWTLVAQDNGSGKSAGLNKPTLLTLKTPLILKPGSYGVALVAVRSGHRYTNGNGTNQTYSNTDMTLNAGAATNVPFTGTIFKPRVWNGSIIYTPATGLFSDFSATPRKGKSPLTVKFTDLTYSSSGSVKTWAWDFNGDNKIDSTLQNPTYTFTATGWDKTFDITLTTTDGVHPPSTVTKKAYIVVNPSNATAVDFGKGSTNKPVPGPIELPKYLRTYSYYHTRGFYFQAPVTFVVTGFRVPNETNKLYQAAVLFTMPKAPPAYPTTYNVVASDIKFFGAGVKAGTIMKPASAIPITKGTWVGVLGCCYSSATGYMYNSYGNGPHKTTILGTPVTLTRLVKQASLPGTKGLGGVSASSGPIGRVEVFVAGNNLVPALTSVGLPQLGTTPKLSLQAKIPGAQVGLLLMGVGRMPVPVPTPYGKLLIKPPFLLSIIVPTGTGQAPLPIPNNPAFTGATLDFQGAVFDLKTATYGMSNGTEWFLGK